MKKKNQKNFCITGGLLLLFVLWTIAIQTIDVQMIGPKESVVGFATLNKFFHELTGVHMLIYTITDWLSIVPILVVMYFALVGLVQLLKRKRLSKVDPNLLLLGGYYIIVLCVYILFEIQPINYRPILINGVLEVSYPSSTTLLLMCIMSTVIMQHQYGVKTNPRRNWFVYITIAFTTLMVLGRMISGVHWFTDIIGGVLLASSLLMLYYSISIKMAKKIP